MRKVLTISVLHFGIGCHMLLNATRTASKQAGRQAGPTATVGATVRAEDDEDEDTELATLGAGDSDWLSLMLGWRRTLAGIFPTCCRSSLFLFNRSTVLAQRSLRCAHQVELNLPRNACHEASIRYRHSTTTAPASAHERATRTAHSARWPRSSLPVACLG